MPAYRPLKVTVVDPNGVDSSPNARPMSTASDESRATTAAETGGQPSIDFEGTSNPYIDYQSIDLLLSLQHPRSTGYDEMCFIVMGQVKELLFRGIHHELVNAKHQIDQDQLEAAMEILHRAVVFLDYLADSWNVLSTISSDGFNQFRDSLGTASGQLSFMYRHVEFALGNKSRRLADAHRNLPHIWPGIENALNSPSLYDSVIALLSRRGLPIANSALDRDWAEPYQLNQSVQDAWRMVYQDRQPYEDLYGLGEQLLLLDTQFSVYRWRHYVTVERIIGNKPGTGGSSGVAWLEAVTKLRFFPELWSVRSS